MRKTLFKLALTLVTLTALAAFLAIGASAAPELYLTNPAVSLDQYGSTIAVDANGHHTGLGLFSDAWSRSDSGKDELELDLRVGALGSTGTLVMVNETPGKITVSFDVEITQCDPTHKATITSYAHRLYYKVTTAYKDDGSPFPAARPYDLQEGLSELTTLHHSFDIDVGQKLSIFAMSSTSANCSLTAVMKNISITSDNVPTVTFPEVTGGTFTASYNGAGAAETAQYRTGIPFTLSAAPAEGYAFLRWVKSVDGVVSPLGYTGELTTYIYEDASVYPEFVPDDGIARFEANGKSYSSLSEALAAADGVVTLIKSGTLPRGTYTVPSGVTLLIPSDERHNVYKGGPVSANYSGSFGNTEFSRLTLASGANIFVDNGGALVVNSLHSNYYYASGDSDCGTPVGGYGHIVTAKSSSITVREGGELYAYGFITGEGRVTAESGSSVAELIQIRDLNTENVKTIMKNGDTEEAKPLSDSVFPFSEYFIQNIECEYIINSGATETVCSTFYVSGLSESFPDALEIPATIEFIGEEGLFQLAPGSSLTRVYHPDTDRISYNVTAGAMDICSIIFYAQYNSSNAATINSSDFRLPIVGNMDITISQGTKAYVKSDTVLLPGATFTIEPGAEAEILDGANVFVTDSSYWYINGDRHSSAVFSPDRTGNYAEFSDRYAHIYVNGTITVNSKLLTTGTSEDGGADITYSSSGVIYYNEAKSYDPETDALYNWSYSKNSSQEIPVTIAKLHNADGSYTETDAGSTGTGTEGPGEEPGPGDQPGTGTGITFRPGEDGNWQVKSPVSSVDAEGNLTVSSIPDTVQYLFAAGYSAEGRLLWIELFEVNGEDSLEMQLSGYFAADSVNILYIGENTVPVEKLQRAK